MKTLLLPLLFLVTLSLVWALKFPGTEPIHECKEGSKDRIPIEHLEISPPCEKDYCPVKVGSRVKVSVRLTPKMDGKTLTLSIYEAKTMALLQPLALVTMPVAFHTIDVCQQKYNTTCPYKANVPIHGFYEGEVGDVKFPVNSGKMMIKAIARDDMKRELVCLDFQIKITPKDGLV